MAASIASYEVSPVVFKSRPSTSGQFCRGLPSLCRVCYAFYCIACSTVARACFMPEPSPRSFSSHSSGFQDERMQKKSTVRVNHISQINGNRSSAVAEMGDRLATIDMGRKVRVLLCPFSGGSGYLTQCRLGRDLPPYQLPSEILINFYSPQMVVTANTTKYTIENDLTKKRKKKNNKQTHRQNGMYLSKKDQLVIKQDM